MIRLAEPVFRSPPLLTAVASVPPGAWAVGVSGGADSVALLAVLKERAATAGDLQLHVVHLDHQTRGDESTTDAAFVANLAANWNLPCTIARRDCVEGSLARTHPNPSARYRDARFALFREVIRARSLQGVILAHHASDQAETVFQRLLRGGSFVGLGGMAADRTVSGVRVLRPLLVISPIGLRRWLSDRDIAWREDASNRSPKYQRNRVRALLTTYSELQNDVLALHDACTSLVAWTDERAPSLGETFSVTEVRDQPELLAVHALRRWLADRGVAVGDVRPATIDRLLTMIRDPASPPRHHVPGRLLIRRRRGIIWAEAAGHRKKESAPSTRSSAPGRTLE